MFFTPFIGLSVAVHLIVIISYKLTNGKFAKDRKIAPGASLLMYGSGLVLIASVFCFVLANALVLVRASVLDKHSNIRLIEDNASLPAKLATEFMGQKTSGNSEGMQSNVLGTSTTASAQPAAQIPVEQMRQLLQNAGCASEYQEVSSGYHNSIIEFTALHNLGRSLPDRTALAHSMGITQYDGAVAQNKELLYTLLAQSNEVSPDCAIADVPLNDTMPASGTNR